MSHEPRDLLSHPEIQSASTGRYLGTALFAFGLMLVACGLTVTQALAPTGLLIALAVINFVAVIAQLGLLFKLDLSEAFIWHTAALVMTIPLFFMAITLTIWMFIILAARVGTGI